MKYYGICFNYGFAYCDNLNIINGIISRYTGIHLHSYAIASEAYEKAAFQFIKHDVKSNFSMPICPPDMDKLALNHLFFVPSSRLHVIPNERFLAVITPSYYGIYTQLNGLMDAMAFFENNNDEVEIKEAKSCTDAFALIQQTYLPPLYYEIAHRRYREVPAIILSRTDVLYPSPFTDMGEFPGNHPMLPKGQ